jgi:hypothetical protein
MLRLVGTQQPVLKHVVRLPLGVVSITLNRYGLGLGDRGGFEAAWANSNEAALTQEEYRAIIKEHLREVYKKQTGQEPPSVTLNLASHQIIDDMVGWSKLNYPTQR